VFANWKTSMSNEHTISGQVVKATSLLGFPQCSQ